MTWHPAFDGVRSYQTVVTSEASRKSNSAFKLTKLHAPGVQRSISGYQMSVVTVLRRLSHRTARFPGA
jgi:hypothetical protein